MKITSSVIGVVLLCAMTVSYAQTEAPLDEMKTLTDIRQLRDGGKLEEAKSLALKYLAIYPHDADVQVLLASVYIQEKDYAGAEAILKIAAQAHPNDPDVTEMLGTLKRAKNEEETTKAEALAAAQYPVVAEGAASAGGMAIGAYAAHAVSGQKKNHIGLFQQSLYATAPDGYWDFTNLYYFRDTDFGGVLGELNYASRNGYEGVQGQVGMTLKMNENVYVDLESTYADNLNLFPNYSVGGEINFNIPEWFGFSIGDTYQNINPTFFYTYTASITKELSKNYLSFRAYHFVPKAGKTSTYYVANARQLIEESNHFIGLTIGYGTIPDLADLLTVNFITLDDRLVALNYERPLIPEALVLDVGLSYEHQKFPTGIIRELTGLTVGFKSRF